MSLLLLFGGAAPSSVTGTSSTTNADDTATASGTVTIVGTSSTTNADDTASASGTITIVGTSSTTNANDSLSASGTVSAATVTGTSATTNADDTATASGTVTIVGTSATTNANDTASAAGSSGTPAPADDATHTGLRRPHAKRRPERQLPVILPAITGVGMTHHLDDRLRADGLVDPHNLVLEDEELLLLV